MSIIKGDTLFVGPSTILELHKLGIWNTVIRDFSVRSAKVTLQNCEECNQRLDVPISVDSAELHNIADVGNVDQPMLNKLAVATDFQVRNTSESERHFLAYVHNCSPITGFICCQEKMICNLLGKLGLGTKLIPIEALI